MNKKAQHNDDVPFCFDRYDDFLGFVVSQSGYSLARCLSNAIKDAGYSITPREFAILNRLHQHKQLNQSEIAEITFKDRPATTRMLDKLEKLAYIQRTMDTKDRRSLNVTLTTDGRRARAKIVPLAVDLIQAGCDGISTRDLKITLKTLQQINSQLNHFN